MMLSAVIKSFNIGLVTVLVCACQPSTSLGSQEQKISINEVYQLGFGLEGEQQFIKYTQNSEDRQPAGMGFYDLLWRAPNLAQVNINLGENSLTIPNAISVLGTKISYDKSMQGIQIMDINAGLNKEEYVTEEQAYQAYKLLFEQINSKGWKQYFVRYSERNAKQDNMRLIMEGGRVIDPSYIFEYSEWKKIFDEKGSLDYLLYSPGYILSITINNTDRKNSRVQYMLRFSFESFKYNRRNLISDSYKMSPIEFNRAYIENNNRNTMLRKYGESEAKLKGYQIDENYKDPDDWQYVK
ncbi:hypothetical protein EC844_14011 [Acinetobacter calcoaceticus]|uniref:Uncharacterized protein n=1 Tax=Acinetobacter calcoaceticus TaxID=471 RepID=A0A4R1XAZ8_ACICA|nr:hypothetical protein EC844_14011 [Acinetobacter calcoaceticus]